MEYVDEEDVYSTSDFYCAVAFLAKGHQIASLDRTNPKRVIFSFEKSESLEQIANLYWIRQLQMNVNEVFEAQRYLKSLIYKADSK